MIQYDLQKNKFTLLRKNKDLEDTKQGLFRNNYSKFPLHMTDKIVEINRCIFEIK